MSAHRLLQRNLKMTARPALGHSRPMRSVPVPINVRCYSNGVIIVRRSEVTLRTSRIGHLKFDC